MFSLLVFQSRSASENVPEQEGDGAVKVEPRPQGPSNQSLLSEEESDEDEQEEATDLPATPWHPKPLGVSAEIVLLKRELGNFNPPAVLGSK